MSDEFGQSKSVDKRLAAHGKQPTVRELFIMLQFRFNGQIDKELEHYASQRAKSVLANAVVELEAMFGGKQK